MSVLVDYLSIALPVFGMTVMTLGGCMCCIWRRIDRRMSQFEEVLRSHPQHTYYPPTPYPGHQPTAPPPIYYPTI